MNASSRFSITHSDILGISRPKSLFQREMAKTELEVNIDYQAYLSQMKDVASPTDKILLKKELNSEVFKRKSKESELQNLKRIYQELNQRNLEPSKEATKNKILKKLDEVNDSILEEQQQTLFLKHKKDTQKECFLVAKERLLEIQSMDKKISNDSKGLQEVRILAQNDYSQVKDNYEKLKKQAYKSSQTNSKTSLELTRQKDQIHEDIQESIKRITTNTLKFKEHQTELNKLLKSLHKQSMEAKLKEQIQNEKLEALEKYQKEFAELKK